MSAHPLKHAVVLSLLCSAALAQDGGAAPRYTLRETEVPEASKEAAPGAPAGIKRARVLADGETMGTKTAGLVWLGFEGTFQQGFHLHPGAELVVVLEGKLALQTPGGSRVLEPGDAAFLPGQALHGWSRPDASAPPTRVLALYAPSGPEQAFKGKGDPKQTQMLNPAKPPKADPNAPQAVVISRKQSKPLPIAQGKGLATLLLEKDSLHGDGVASAGWLELRAGAAVPAHVHAGEEEFLYVVSGRGEMTVLGQKEPIAPGTVVHIPANTSHAAVVTSKEPLIAVQFYAPGGPEQRFKAPPATSK